MALSQEDRHLVLRYLRDLFLHGTMAFRNTQGTLRNVAVNTIHPRDEDLRNHRPFLDLVLSAPP